MIDTEQIKITKVAKSRIQEVDFDNIQFGREYSDHMFRVEFKDGSWQDPKIVPYDYLRISPASQALHYGVSVFEGMKAYKNVNGEPVLFRPLDNHARINRSADRICMPPISAELFMEGMTKLLQLDADWIPTGDEASLYVRPIMFSSEEYVGIKTSDSFTFLILTSPVGVYYSKPVKVKIEMHYARAVAGGTGSAKAAGNYAGALYPTKLAQQEGYQQLIWTDGKEHKYIEEAGTMNLMFIIDDVIVTPELTDTLLHGITRDSVLTIARDLGYPVEERKITVDEVVNSLREGRMQDAFGVGTAATITHLSEIGFEGVDYMLPDVSTRKVSRHLRETMEGIKRGTVPDKFGWVYKI